MNFHNKKLEEAYNFLSSISSKAYINYILLANPVLSKHPYMSNFTREYLAGNKATILNNFYLPLYLIYKLPQYYIKSATLYILYVITFMLCRKRNKYYQLAINETNLTVIDTFFIVQQIEKGNDYSDSYFPGLDRILIKESLNFIYVPFFYGSRNPIRLARIHNLLKKKNVPFVSEYQLFSFSDISRLLYYIIIYPIHVFNLYSKTRKKRCYRSDLLAQSIIETIDGTVLPCFTRYLLGEKISAFDVKRIKCISWYENQPINKCFYKGLRLNPLKKVAIIGAQLFIWPESLLNIHPDENELKHNVIPDKILVNGPHYLPAKTKLNYSVGPSLRYQYLFEQKLIPDKKLYDFLFLPSYFKNETRNLLHILHKCQDIFLNKKSIIKFHPATKTEPMLKKIHINIQVTNQSLATLLPNTKIVIGSASGALVEAISQGIPAIVLVTPGSLHLNYLAEYGKGIIWDEAHNVSDIIFLITKFEGLLRNEKNKLDEVAQKCRDMYFCATTEQKIHNSFEI